MKTIKFSHEYSKFPFRIEDMDRTMLLEVFVSDNLSKEFVEYDSHILGNDRSNPDSYYPLPSGKVLVLLLKTQQEDFDSIPDLWTTVRRWTPEKEQYYRGLRGQQVNISIEQKVV